MKTILVIEDDELNRKLVKTILTRQEFRVIETLSAQMGIELARQDRPDLILMDIRLPGMDGLRATRLLRGDAQLKGIPVVMLSAFSLDEDRAEAREAGCSGYITKPIDVKAFVQEIRRYLP